MSDLLTRFQSDPDGTQHVISVQDVEPYLEENKRRRESNTVGQDWKHKWHLPNVLVEKFYAEYTGGSFRPMNEEFWVWLDRKIMTDPDWAYFRTNDPASPFFLGYRK